MIIVTGGLGFIGGNLVQKLRKQGNFVVVLDTKEETLDSIYIWLTTNARDIECIYHLGAITDTTIMNSVLFGEYNLFSSMFIWNLCAEYQIPLVYASSAATYGDGEQGFDDEKGRGTLFFELERIFKEKKPKIIFLENFNIF